MAIKEIQQGKFSSYLNCGQKIVSETGPRSILISRMITQLALNEIVYSKNSVQKMKSRALNATRINWVNGQTLEMNIKMSLRNALPFYWKINISATFLWIIFPNARVALDLQCFQKRLYVDICVDGHVLQHDKNAPIAVSVHNIYFLH